MTSKPLVAITGASSGIGEATARAFSAAGHPVLMMARRLERMTGFGLPDSIASNVDVRDRAAIAAAVSDAEALYGPVDMMFCNAGIARLADIGGQNPDEWDEMIDINTKGVMNSVHAVLSGMMARRRGTLVMMSSIAGLGGQNPDEWDEMIDINTKGVMNSVHAVLSGMMARRRGTLVMMSSIAGRKVYPDHTVYCGTKFFVHAISESLREYLSGHDVRVIVISPGIIETEVLDHVTDPNTLANYKANKAKIGGGIPSEHVADLILNAYNLPQNALVQEICITPTRQSY